MAYREDWFEAERLHRAAQDGVLQEMAQLVEHGSDVNQFDDLSRTPLHHAVEGEHYNAAKWLLEHGARVNANDEVNIGETPLCLAVQRDYPEMVELLMQHGADPDITGWMGLTARMRANRRTDEDGRRIREILSRYKR